MNILCMTRYLRDRTARHRNFGRVDGRQGLRYPSRVSAPLDLDFDNVKC